MVTIRASATAERKPVAGFIKRIKLILKIPASPAVIILHCIAMKFRVSEGAQSPLADTKFYGYTMKYLPGMTFFKFPGSA